MPSASSRGTRRMRTPVARTIRNLCQGLQVKSVRVRSFCDFLDKSRVHLFWCSFVLFANCFCLLQNRCMLHAFPCAKVKQQRTDVGYWSMKYKEQLPHSSLQDYVKCFWILEHEYTPEKPTEDVTPDSFVELILNFGSPYFLQSAGQEDREMPSAFLVGLQQKPLLYRCDGTVKLVCTRFHAWGTLPFLETPTRTENKLAINLGKEWHDLFHKLTPLVEAGNYDGAVAGVEDFLIGKLLAASVDLKQIETAAKMLHLQKGQFRISELADYCNLSSRQLQRVFRDSMGVSPKVLARTIRFEEIRRRLMFEPEANLTDLAYEFGYTDQAHFIRDFKEFAGRTPGEFAAEMRAFQDVFRDDNVVFLQFNESQSD